MFVKFMNLNIIVFLTLVALGCSKDSGTPVEGSVEKNVTEFTPFHPETGNPIAAADLNTDLLKDDPILEKESFWPREAKEVAYPEVEVEKEKKFSIFGWSSKGEYNSGITNTCHFTALEKILRETSTYNSDVANKIQEWAKVCEKELSRGRTSSIFTALRFDSIRYDITKMKITPLEFTFSDQIKLGGLLFLKDTKKRPLIIFKAGLYGDAADGGVLRNFVMHLVEESPFHFLYLGNVTGEKFTKDNGDLFLGGFDEGRHIVRVAQDVMGRAEIAPLVEDIHVLGVSLGSQGALYSSLYSSFMEESPSKIKSTFAFCPVVNLKPTMESLFDNSLRATFYESLTINFLRSIYDLPSIKQIFDPTKKISRQDLFKSLKKGVIRNYIRRTEKTPWDLAPFYGFRIESEEDYWQVNNFIDYADKVKIPTMVIHAKDDFLVKSSINGDELYKKIQNKNSAIGVVEFQNGSHCGFNVALSWPTVSTMLREYVLKHSTYKPELEEISIPIPKINHTSLGGKSVITKSTWEYKERREQLILTLTYFDSKESYGGRSCHRFRALYAPDICYKTIDVKMGLGVFAAAKLTVPKDEDEALRLLRWLNTRSYLVDDESNLVFNTPEWPTQIRFQSSEY